MVGDDGCKRGEEWSKEDTDITDVNGDIQEVQHVVEDSRGHHET